MDLKVVSLIVAIAIGIVGWTALTLSEGSIDTREHLIWHCGWHDGRDEDACK